MFFIDKYIPKKQHFFHKNTYNFLNLISNDESIPHLIFHGIDGVGKKTMVNTFLEYLYGDDVTKTKLIKYIVSCSGPNVKEEHFIESNYHIEIIPKGNNNDRYLIQDVVKRYAANTYCNIFNSKHKFKVIVIHNIHDMLPSVQFSLRRIIEKYSDTCRFILVTNSISKLIKPLISRCHCIKLKYPTNEEIIKYCFTIANKENINLTLNRLTYILHTSNNLKELLWKLEIFKTHEYYIEFLNNKFEELKEEFNKIEDGLNSNIINKELIKLQNYSDNLLFMHKNINSFINNFANTTYNNFNKILKQHVSTTIYNNTLVSCKTFLQKFNKDNFKSIKILVDNKKIKLDEVLYNIKTIYNKITSTIKLFEIKTDKEIVIDTLVELILLKDMNNFSQIRDIFFNYVITNFTGTEIVQDILVRLLKRNISEDTKAEIIKICTEGEYNLIFCRREINQFDMIIINIIDVLRNKK